ncbi:MAG: PIN domain-containing protein [Acidiferrobacter sp.]
MILDTNVLLSGISYPGSIPGKILATWRHGSLEVLLSAYILDELRRILPRLAHRHGLNPAEQRDLADILAIQAEVITSVLGHEPALRGLHDPPGISLLCGQRHRRARPGPERIRRLSPLKARSTDQRIQLPSGLCRKPMGLLGHVDLQRHS